MAWNICIVLDKGTQNPSRGTIALRWILITVFLGFCRRQKGWTDDGIHVWCTLNSWCLCRHHHKGVDHIYLCNTSKVPINHWSQDLTVIKEFQRSLEAIMIGMTVFYAMNLYFLMTYSDTPAYECFDLWIFGVMSYEEEIQYIFVQAHEQKLELWIKKKSQVQDQPRCNPPPSLPLHRAASPPPS